MDVVAYVIFAAWVGGFVGYFARSFFAGVKRQNAEWGE